MVASEIWNYATRTLTQSKFQFWSAIITQQYGVLTVPGGSVAYVDIRPPSGETWFVSISTCPTSLELNWTLYGDYNGSTMRPHNWNMQQIGIYEVNRILTNSLWGRIGGSNGNASYERSVYYGYSGFKLSMPHWTPNRFDSAKPFKLNTDLQLPEEISMLNKYKALVIGVNPAKPFDYDLAIVLEENTPLAFDPNTGFPIELKSVYVKADVLANLIVQFRKGTVDYVNAGYEQYLKKWKAEGIDLGII
jgi:hypothetical protein